MSVKDTRYKRQCPICTDTLPGTDDALQVFESLKAQVEDIDGGNANYVTPNCDLCGEECSISKARSIVERCEPKLMKSSPGEFDE